MVVQKAVSVSSSSSYGTQLLDNTWYVIYYHIKARILTSFVATSVDVERVFSQGRLLLSHVRSRLSVQSTRALMCLGSWSIRGFVKDFDIRAVTVCPEVARNDSEEELPIDWDAMDSNDSEA